MALLEVEDVSVRFGGTVALSHVSLEADAGVVTGLIGPNGAGKTTLFNVVTGLQTPNLGTVLIGGEDITGLKPYKRARRGVARTFQRLELFGLLSVRDNLRVAADIRRGWDRGGHPGPPIAGGDRHETPLQTADRILADIGLAGSWAVRNVWTQKDLGEVQGSIATSIRHHGVVLVRLDPR